MGKVKTRILGLEEIEEKQKKEQKEKAAIKKMAKSKVKDEEKNTDVKKESIEKKEKTKKLKTAEKKVSSKSRGKKYMKAVSLVDKKKIYEIREAVSLLKQMKTSNFDESVELHLSVLQTGLKGEAALPYSTGKKIRIAVVDDKILDKLESGKIDFDILVTHPSFMPKLAKFAKILGPRGLMPNPKAGTISINPDEIVKKFEKGVVKWKTEPKFPLVHLLVGKVSHDDKNLVENAKKLIESVGIKNIVRAYMKSTMSPSLRIELAA